MKIAIAVFIIVVLCAVIRILELSHIRECWI
jgi:hypothetical protein